MYRNGYFPNHEGQVDILVGSEGFLTDAPFPGVVKVVGCDAFLPFRFPAWVRTMYAALP